LNVKLSDAARRILNNAELISIRDGWFARLRRLFNGADDVQTVFAVNGVNGNSGNTSVLYGEPERWAAESLENLAEHAERARNADIFTPLCIQNDVFGVHYVDSIFGCNVFFGHNQWYNDYIDCEVGELPSPDIGKSEAWQLTKRATETFVGADVKLPVYGLLMA
jgi:hypothetical protein